MGGRHSPGGSEAKGPQAEKRGVTPDACDALTNEEAEAKTCVRE